MKGLPTKSLWVHLECWVNLENKGKKQLGFGPARGHDTLPSPVTLLHFLHLLLEYFLPDRAQVKWGLWQNSVLLGGLWCVGHHLPQKVERPGLDVGHLTSNPALHCLPSLIFQMSLSSAWCLGSHQWVYSQVIESYWKSPLFKGILLWSLMSQICYLHGCQNDLET